jgi:hypothetical protein
MYKFTDLTNLQIMTTTNFYLQIYEFNEFTNYDDYEFLCTNLRI